MLGGGNRGKPIGSPADHLPRAARRKRETRVVTSGAIFILPHQIVVGNVKQTCGFTIIGERTGADHNVDMCHFVCGVCAG